MTDQEMFDYVVTNLVAQGKQSVRKTKGEWGCAYRGGNGCRCAAGWMIPDDRYLPDMEGEHTGAPIVAPVLGISTDQESLMIALQRAHDFALGGVWNNNTWDGSTAVVDDEVWLHHFLKGVRQVAEKHHLSTEVVDLAEAVCCV